MPDPAPNDDASRPPDGMEMLCAGVLRSDFGRRPSRALDKAMMQLAAEEAWLESQSKLSSLTLWDRIRSWFALSHASTFALGTALVLLIGFGAWHLWRGSSHPKGAEEISACILADALDARWTGAQPQIGDALHGSLQLESGTVELTFTSGARIALEGPANLRLTGPNSMQLDHGRLATDVPVRARGFSIQTPNATVIDLGTRFGLDVGRSQATEVNVFEGRVQLQSKSTPPAGQNQWELTRNMAMVVNSQGAATAKASPETAFPQPGRAVFVRPKNCGFDALNDMQIGTVAGGSSTWTGPAFTLTGPVAGVTPVEGSGMLRFLPPPRGPGGRPLDSEVWQVLDLRPAREFISTFGTVDLKCWVQFNRIPGTRTANTFRLSVAAFPGQPSNVASLWSNREATALLNVSKELATDDDPLTWERVEVDTSVTSKADFVIICLSAVAPKEIPTATNPFPGHFADLIDLKVCLPMRPSSLASAR